MLSAGSKECSAPARSLCPRLFRSGEVALTSVMVMESPCLKDPTTDNGWITVAAGSSNTLTGVADPSFLPSEGLVSEVGFLFSGVPSVSKLAMGLAGLCGRLAASDLRFFAGDSFCFACPWVTFMSKDASKFPPMWKCIVKPIGAAGAAGTSPESRGAGVMGVGGTGAGVR